MPSSRKKRIGSNRFASPPLQPSSLVTRNLIRLPVGLGNLAHDATFVFPLRRDISDLLNDFAERYLQLHSYLDSLSIQASQTDHPTLTSPFQVFTRCWIDRGWDYVHFAYGDHIDTQKLVFESITRVFLEHLRPLLLLVKYSNSSISDHKQALTAIGTVFALYLLWETQVFPDTGVGCASSHRPMERVRLEQDLYQLILQLPFLCQDALQSCSSKRLETPPPIADTVLVIGRLCGMFPMAANQSTSPHPPQQGSASNKGKRKATDAQHFDTDNPPDSPDNIFKGNVNQTTIIKVESGIIDVIPATIHATRLPRTFPSTQIMSAMQANRQFRRLARLVRIEHQVEPVIQQPSSSSALEDPWPTPPPTKQRLKLIKKETITGLSRGDLIRLRARERLDLAIADAFGSSSSSSSSTSSSSSPIQAKTNKSKEVKFSIELPTWIASRRYTSRLKPWLDATSLPLERALDKLTEHRERYLETRKSLFSATHADASSSSSNLSTCTMMEDIPAALLQQLTTDPVDQQPAGNNDTQPNQMAESLDEHAQQRLSIQDLYHIAARRTQQAILQAKDEIQRRTSLDLL